MTGELLETPDDDELTDAALARLAKRYAKQAWGCLVLAVRTEDLDMRVRVQAAESLLERGFGRAPQSAPIPQYLSADDLAEIIKRSTGQYPRDEPLHLGAEGYPSR